MKNLKKWGEMNKSWKYNQMEFLKFSGKIEAKWLIVIWLYNIQDENLDYSLKFYFE